MISYTWHARVLSLINVVLSVVMCAVSVGCLNGLPSTAARLSGLGYTGVHQSTPLLIRLHMKERSFFRLSPRLSQHRLQQRPLVARTASAKHNAIFADIHIGMRKSQRSFHCPLVDTQHLDDLVVQPWCACLHMNRLASHVQVKCCHVCEVWFLVHQRWFELLHTAVT